MNGDYEDDFRPDVWANGEKEITEEVDPNRCYQVSCKKEGVGRFFSG